MATFTTVPRVKTTWVAPPVIPAAVPEVDYLFSDASDFLFSDGNDYVFSEATTTIRTETAWTPVTKTR